MKPRHTPTKSPQKIVRDKALLRLEQKKIKYATYIWLARVMDPKADGAEIPDTSHRAGLMCGFHPLLAD